MTTKPTSTSDAIKKLEAKDDEPNNESARTNETLIGKGSRSDEDPVEASIRLNDPSLSRAAYTSSKSGFNEDLERDDSLEDKSKTPKSQTSLVNKKR